MYIGAVVLIYVIYILITYIFGMNHVKTTLLRDIVSAKDEDVIKAKTIPSTPFGQGVRYTVSFWVYVNDLNYKYGEKKYIFTKQLPGTTTPSIEIYIDPKSASLMLDVVDSSNPEQAKQIQIGVIPLRKWQQFTIVQESNILDVFIDGKIVFTSDPAVQVISSPGEDIILSKNGGWSGYKAKVMYSNYNQNLQEVGSQLSAGPLSMSWMNPLYYLDLLMEIINYYNNQVLAFTLPDPEKEAQKSLEQRNAAIKKRKEAHKGDKPCSSLKNE